MRAKTDTKLHRPTSCLQSRPRIVGCALSLKSLLVALKTPKGKYLYACQGPIIPYVFAKRSQLVVWKVYEGVGDILTSLNFRELSH